MNKNTSSNNRYRTVVRQVHISYLRGMQAEHEEKLRQMDLAHQERLRQIDLDHAARMRAIRAEDRQRSAISPIATITTFIVLCILMTIVVVL